MPDSGLFPELAPLREWFDSFCASYGCSDPEAQRNYDLKELHTRKVCEAARLIAEGGSARRILLAEVTALCHDLGRFPQYRDYGTFKDSDSVNHAHLSAQVLKQCDQLNFLSETEAKNVITAVRLHNVYTVPSGLEPEAEDLLRIVRDADKLDIWRVFIEYFETPESERASAAGLGFPDLPHCSPEVLAEIGAGRMVQLSSVKSLNDFKLLQLSWVYDINFQSTLGLIVGRGIMERLSATLPRGQAVSAVLEAARSYVERRAGEL